MVDWENESEKDNLVPKSVTELSSLLEVPNDCHPSRVPVSYLQNDDAIATT